MAIFRLVDLMTSYLYTQQQQELLKANVKLLPAQRWRINFQKGEQFQKGGSSLVTKDQI